MITLLSTLTACYKNDESQTKETPIITAQPMITAVPKENQSPDFTNDSNSDRDTYNLTESNFTNNEGIEISYPQITGLVDLDKQDKINEMIKSDAMYYVEDYDNVAEESSLEIDYNILWKGPKLLSMQFWGYSYIKGAAYPVDNFYTTNIDIENGEKIKLSDVVLINKDFIKKFDESKYVTPILSEDENTASIIKELVGDYDLEEYFNNADSFNEYNTFSYFTEDSIGISVSVPHVAGDHAEFEIKYKDISDNIKVESAIWDDFPEVY